MSPRKTQDADGVLAKPAAPDSYSREQIEALFKGTMALSYQALGDASRNTVSLVTTQLSATISQVSQFLLQRLLTFIPKIHI